MDGYTYYFCQTVKPHIKHELPSTGMYIVLLGLWISLRLTIEQTSNLFHPFIDIEAQVDDEEDEDEENEDDGK